MYMYVIIITLIKIEWHLLCLLYTNTLKIKLMNSTDCNPLSQQFIFKELYTQHLNHVLYNLSQSKFVSIEKIYIIAAHSNWLLSSLSKTWLKKWNVHPLPLCTFADRVSRVPHKCRILMFAWQKECLPHWLSCVFLGDIFHLPWILSQGHLFHGTYTN